MPPLRIVNNMGQESKTYLDQVREKLEGQRGQDYWRSLDEIAETPEFQAWVEDEFPNRSTLAQIDRRSLLKFMGASMVLAGLGGCRSMRLPTEKIVPYVTAPEGVTLGKPNYFATAFAFQGTALGVVVKSLENRPIKIEGNPNHPASLGATDHFAQASLLDLYDPDRAKGVQYGGKESSWDILLQNIRVRLDDAKATGGAGLVVVTEAIHSPTLGRLLKDLFAKYPEATWVEFDPVVNSVLPIPIYHLDKAKVVLSIDGDFLNTMPNSVRMAKDFMSKRKISGKNVEGMNRLYAVEVTPTTTGAMADHRLALSPAQLVTFVQAVQAEMQGGTADTASLPAAAKKWIAPLVKDLKAAGSEAVVVCGPQAPPAVQEACYVMNQALGSVPTCAELIPSYFANPNPRKRTLKDLKEDLEKGRATTVVVLGGDPVYGSGDAMFAELLQKAPFSLHLTSWVNDTSAACKWIAAESHYLESWGDVIGYDGTTSIVQPLIEPLHSSKTQSELVSVLLNGTASGHELLKTTYAGTSEEVWDKWLNEGVVSLPKPTGLVATQAAPVMPTMKGGLTVVFRPDSTIWDGRFANNGWLQETPKVMTTLTWENAAMLSAKKMEELKLKEGDHVKVTVGNQSVEIPALLLIGQPDDVVTLHLGYGRLMGGNVATRTLYKSKVGKTREQLVSGRVGVDVNPLRSPGSWIAEGATIEKVKGRTRLALTQTHHSMEGRNILKSVTVEEYLANPDLKTHGDKLADKNLSMWPENHEEFPFEGPQWGMTIDLALCTGCHACVTACQAENNIPVVGKDQVLKGREMHWLRIDRYYRLQGRTEAEEAKGVMTKNNELTDQRDIYDPEKGYGDVLDANNVVTVFSPIACMHCEKAPCEPVCPVAATVHSMEGLNQMIYNRCVGTRYCSNNCPYKVRRFNYLNYTDNQAQFMDRKDLAYDNNDFINGGIVSGPKPDGRNLLKLVNNPSVTVRGRGVMEKCTYCTQRISEARIQAKKENRPIADGEIVTACQQACPTSAITFGNIADKNSEVSKRRAETRDYTILPELNTKNRTSYLARLSNPNKELMS